MLLQRRSKLVSTYEYLPRPEVSGEYIVEIFEDQTLGGFSYKIFTPHYSGPRILVAYGAGGMATEEEAILGAESKMMDLWEKPADA